MVNVMKSIRTESGEGNRLNHCFTLLPGAGTKYPIAVKNSGSLGKCTNLDSLSFINISPLQQAKQRCDKDCV